jgi:hypothetical protein
MTLWPIILNTNSVEELAIERALPVPRWNDLPAYARKDLAGSAYDQSWFDARDDRTRLTVLNLHVKLSGMGLWHYVGKRGNTSVGALEFQASNVNSLKARLANFSDFERPGDSPKEWDSREARVRCSLHFKHLEGWVDDTVQAHIDTYGLSCGSSTVGHICAVALGPAHLLYYDGYQDVLDIRDTLLEQGWDRACLVGKNEPIPRTA